VEKWIQISDRDCFKESHQVDGTHGLQTELVPANNDGLYAKSYIEKEYEGLDVSSKYTCL